MGEATFTFRVDEALKSAFAAAAKADDRTGAQLIRDFMRDYVAGTSDEHDTWFRRRVQIAQASANAGRLIPAADVEAKFRARREATRRRLATSE